jgi:hypothetical protein
MRNSGLTVVVCLTGMIALPGCAAAQQNRDSVHLRNDCRLAIQVVTTEHPAPHEAWAYEAVEHCGAAGGAALASAIDRMRRTDDLAVLDLITRPVIRFTDASVLDVTLSVAGDGGASPEARVFAFRALINLLDPGRVLTYAQLAGTGDARSCFGLPPSLHNEPTTGSPLPADAKSRIREMGTRVSADASEPPHVRRAATCAAYHASR